MKTFLHIATQVLAVAAQIKIDNSRVTPFIQVAQAVAAIIALYQKPPKQTDDIPVASK